MARSAELNDTAGLNDTDLNGTATIILGENCDESNIEVSIFLLCIQGVSIHKAKSL